MNSGLIIGLVVLCMMAGGLTVGLGIFLFFLYRNIRDMTAAAKVLSTVMQPFAKERNTEKLVEALLAVRAYLPEITRASAALSDTMSKFIQVVLADPGVTREFTSTAAPKNPLPNAQELNIQYDKGKYKVERKDPGEAEAFAPEGAGSFAAPTDGELAATEIMAQLKKGGFEATPEVEKEMVTAHAKES